MALTDAAGWATGDAAESALKSVVIYLLIYAFSNLGAFAVVIAVSRKTHSGEISSFGGLMSYAPGMGALMTIFLASLTGVPPLGIWIAKLLSFKTLLDAGGSAASTLAVIAAVNTVIAAARSASGMSTDAMLAAFDEASAAFARAANDRFPPEARP